MSGRRPEAAFLTLGCSEVVPQFVLVLGSPRRPQRRGVLRRDPFVT